MMGGTYLVQMAEEDVTEGVHHFPELFWVVRSWVGAEGGEEGGVAVEACVYLTMRFRV